MFEEFGPYIAGFVFAVFVAFIYSKVTKKSIALPGTGTSGGGSTGDDRPPTHMR